MKKIGTTLVMLSVVFSTTIYAKEGEMGYFGGTSSGVKLPTVIESSQDKKTTSTKQVLSYKENIYLTGKGEELTGTIEFKLGTVDKAKGKGKYTESYTTKASNNDGTVKLNRSITLNTEYVYNEQIKQTTKISNVSKWSETIMVNGDTYTLDKKESTFAMSVLEEYMPGVTYYRGDLQYDAVYKKGNSNEGIVTVSVMAPIYGYESPYSKGEVQKRTININGGKEQFYITETPVMTVYKDMQYDKNEPNAISMDGNYKDLIRAEGYLNYNIIQGSIDLSKKEATGSLNISSAPLIEQLAIPKISNIAGIPSQNDIKRLYSLGVIPIKADTYSPNTYISKKEYVVMLSRVLQLKVESQKVLAKRQNPFKDISPSDQYYPELIAAYDAGLTGGGMFNGDSTPTKEQTLTFNIRALGLERLGAAGGITTPFKDGEKISSWARTSVYAAFKLGLVTSIEGSITPHKKITHAEAATLLNNLITYMRNDLQKDYNENMTF